MPSRASARLAVLVVGFLAGLGVAGCRGTVPIAEIRHAPLASPSGAELADVSEAIWRAGRRLGWHVEREGPGDLVATRRLRSHFASIRITHDLEEFRISLQHSRNLDQEGGRIHPAYNAWVDELSREIQAEPIRPGDPAR